MAVIALDVGGSSVKHGLVDCARPAEFAVQTTRINSRGSASEIIGVLASIINGYRLQHPAVAGIGIGFPGPFDYEHGVSYIQGVAKYEALYGLSVRDLLGAAPGAPGLPIRFCNDAEAAIIGEAIYGGGAAFRRVIGVTLGTGLGSSFVADGRRVAEGEGLPEGGWLYPVLFEGKRADDLFSTRGLLGRFEASGIHASRVTHADQSDERIQKVYREFGRDLGRFLRPFAEAFRAECVIVLGGISGAFALFSDELTRELAPVRVMRGLLDKRAALLGIAHLYREAGSD